MCTSVLKEQEVGPQLLWSCKLRIKTGPTLAPCTIVNATKCKESLFANEVIKEHVWFVLSEDWFRGKPCEVLGFMSPMSCPWCWKFILVFFPLFFWTAFACLFSLHFTPCFSYRFCDCTHSHLFARAHISGIHSSLTRFKSVLKRLENRTHGHCFCSLFIDFTLF